MRIEKINENQIKFFLTKTDLLERNIDLLELAKGTEKAQALFRDIMEKAMEVCGFNAENVLLMVEAMSVSTDSIIIIVSKVTNDEEVDTNIKLDPPSKNERRYLVHDVIDSHSDISENFNTLIYSFDCLDDVSDASRAISDIFGGESALYKMNGKYTLILDSRQSDILSFDSITSTLSEYGTKQPSNSVSKYHILEFAEPIIKNNAVYYMSEL